MLAFAARRTRRPGVHDDHRVGPRHPQRQHDHRRPRRRARAGAALPAARAGRPIVAGVPTPTCCTGGVGSCRTSPESGCRRSSTPPSWAPGSRSRCPTSRSAAPATSSARSSTATSRRSASTSTPDCWRRRSRSEKAELRGRPPVVARPSTVIDLPVDAYLPDDYVRRGAAQAGALPAAGARGDRRTSCRRRARPNWSTDSVPAPPPVERLLEVARLRITAEAAGLEFAGSRGWPAGHPLRR